MFCTVCEDTGIEMCPECEGKGEDHHCHNCSDLREVECMCKDFKDEEFLVEAV